MNILLDECLPKRLGRLLSGHEVKTTRQERLRAVQRESLRQAQHLFQSLLHHAFTQLF